MNDPRRFRLRLAARIAGVLGAAALIGPHASCGGGAGGAPPGGTAGGAVHGGSGGVGLGGAPGAGGAGGDMDAGQEAGPGGAMEAGSDAGGGGAMDAGQEAGPGGADGAGGAGGIGGAGGAGGIGGAGGAGGATPVELCFPWTAEAGPCPTDFDAALAVFLSAGCPRGFEPNVILAGPLASAAGECCYTVEVVACSPTGRPFLVEDRARRSAAVVAADGWREGDRPSLDGLTAEERASLAETWTAAALAEHASVASFSRFSLDLLAAGAPGDLVERAHEAALDEIRHARVCFALAAAYAGEDVAPGPFPLGGAVRAGGSLAEIAVSAAVEGCVGETVGAVVAAEQLARATDAAVRAALARIAADEARHAELAWRTVSWAVRAGGREVRAAVTRTLLAQITARAAEEGASAGAPEVAAHGQLDAATYARIRAEAMADVVVPCARALLA